MKLRSLLKGIHAIDSADDPEIRGVVCDSRQVRPGHVFVAVRGTREDGATYIADAITRGAVAVITDRPRAGGYDVPVLCVEDTGMTLARLAARYYGHPADRLRMIRVTDTNRAQARDPGFRYALDRRAVRPQHPPMPRPTHIGMREHDERPIPDDRSLAFCIRVGGSS